MRNTKRREFRQKRKSGREAEMKRAAMAEGVRRVILIQFAIKASRPIYSPALGKGAFERSI